MIFGMFSSWKFHKRSKNPPKTGLDLFWREYHLINRHQTPDIFHNNYFQSKNLSPSSLWHFAEIYFRVCVSVCERIIENIRNMQTKTSRIFERMHSIINTIRCGFLLNVILLSFSRFFAVDLFCFVLCVINDLKFCWDS